MTTNPILNSPLPFQGQKRMFVKQFATALDEITTARHVTTIVDLFGGSGLLSHTAKRLLPDCRVIWNDFDNFRERLTNIPRTNALLAELRETLADYPHAAKLDTTHRDRVIRLVECAERNGYVDHITLSESLLFSSRYALTTQELCRQGMYNRIKMADYLADGYLEGVEVVRYDYKELFAQFRDRDDVLFIVDPPYLSTDTKSYSEGTYWRIGDYLDVLLVLMTGNYIYFTSNKSQIVELCDWFASHFGFDSPLSGAVMKTHKVKSKAINYTDMMFYRAKL